MRQTIFSLVVIMAVSACNSTTVPLAVKKKELAELKAKKTTIEKKIKTLEAEIAKLDTTTTNVPAVFVNVDTIHPSQFKHYITVQGKITSEENILASPERSGVITKVYVEEGDRVSRGQLLAKMDASALQSQLNQLKTNYQLAKTTYLKRKKLWEQKIGSEIQLLQAKSQKEALESQMDAIKAQIANTRINAPVSGTVDAVLLKQGEMASPGKNGIRVVNMSELKVSATLADRYAPHVKKGDEIRIYLPSLNDTILTELTFVSQVIDPQSRTINIEAKLDNKNKRLKPNMLAKIAINNYTADSATVVLSNVLLRDPNSINSYYIMGVTKQQDTTYVAKRYEVEIGEQYNGKTEIISGLPENPVIITYGFAKVAEGQPIRFE